MIGPHVSTPRCRLGILTLAVVLVCSATLLPALAQRSRDVPGVSELRERERAASSESATAGAESEVEGAPRERTRDHRNDDRAGDRAGDRREARGVAHLRIESALDVGMLSHLRRALGRARQLAGGGTPRLLIEIDTPGGAVDLMSQIAGLIGEAQRDGVQVSGWVHRRAYSAGALIAMACDPLVMSPEGAVGAAAPVIPGPDGIMKIPDEVVRAKVTAALRSEFRAWAERNHRPAVLAEAMVDGAVGVREVLVDGVRRLVSDAEYDDARARGDSITLVRTIVRSGDLASLSAGQAVELGFAQATATSPEEALNAIGAGGAALVEVPRSRSDELAALLDKIKYVLLVAGLLAAWTEIKTPGFGAAGSVAIACIGLFLFGRYLVGIADVLPIVAVAVGVVLIAVEIFLMPGTLWLGVVGALLAVGGLVASSVVPAGGFSPLGRAFAVDEMFRLSVGLLVAALGALGLSRVLPRAPLVSRLVLDSGAGSARGAALAESTSVAHKRSDLVGRRAIARTDLRPVGKVDVDGTAGELEARAEGVAIDRGAHVRVVGVASGRLVVRPEPAEAT